MPAPIKFPPHDEEYHLMTVPIDAVPPLRVSALVPPKQITAGKAVAEAGFVDFCLTVTVTVAHAEA